MAGFAAVESRVPHPLIPLPLLRRRPVWTMLLTTSLVGGAAHAVGTVMFLLALMPAIPGVSDGLGFSAPEPPRQGRRWLYWCVDAG
ncbi:hypothetical protein [Parafrankia elaeagni]|uniref:hypothetical protein n=1 Tax=Parafrankia elaeagni TaxID=222534 RepID=UPI00037896B2|nr:hypothetical protein [Parafrankia elaeagni]